jgi:glycosyltransferase involved in cell wall biosynthesis
MKKNGIYSCLVPVFNERQRVINVLISLSQVPEISEVICIDDGSTDGSAEEIQRTCPKVKLICHKINQGKVQAVRTGLERAINDAVILIDGDLLNLDATEISQAIGVFERNYLDCLLLCARPVNIFDYFTRIFIRLPHCVTGNRIIKKSDLVVAIGNPALQGYQLEFAQNIYLMKHNKHVAFINISAKNFWKIQKIGLIRGVVEDMHMWTQSLQHVGIVSVFQQIAFFARKKYEG